MIDWLNPLFLICVSTGLIFIVTAIIGTKYPPKGINQIYGYRTKRSMSSQERWDFAQKYSNDLTQKYGILLVLLGFIGYFIKDPSQLISVVIATILVILTCLALFYKTENALKEKFGND